MLKMRIGVNNLEVRKTLRTEFERLMKQLGTKGLSANEIFDIAQKEGRFDPKDYVYTKDKKELYEFLTYSIALCRIWADYKASKPDAQIEELNLCFITYMRDMWGLEKVE